MAKEEKTTVRVASDVDPVIVEWLDRKAEESKRSRSAQIAVELEQAKEREEKQEDKPK